MDIRSKCSLVKQVKVNTTWALALRCALNSKMKWELCCCSWVYFSQEQKSATGAGIRMFLPQVEEPGRHDGRRNEA